MGSLEPFWRHLEFRPHAAETKAEWRRVLGEAFPAVAEHLTSTGRFASFVASPRLNAPDMRVVRYRDGSLAAVCDSGDTPTLPLTADDLALMTVSAKSLRSALSAALNLRTSTVPAPALPGSLRVGAWEPQPETAFPVVMVAHPDERQVGTLAREAALASDRPTLILTPTGESWTDELIGWCETKRAVMGSLADLVVEDDEHAWAASEKWEALQDGFARRAGFTRQAGTQNKRPRRRRGEFLVKIEAIRRELVQEAESRVNIVKYAHEAGNDPFLPAIAKSDICRRARINDYDYSRAARDKSGADLEDLYNLMQDPNGLLRWWANHRRVTPACS